MKLLFDTNAFNYYIKSLTGKYEGIPQQVHVQGLIDLVSRHRGGRNLLLHSTTVYELFIKCTKENFYQQTSLIDNNKMIVTRFVDDFNQIKDQGFRLINEKGEYRFDLELLDEHFNNTGKSLLASKIIDRKINYEQKMIERFFVFIILICSDVFFDKYGNIVDENLFNKFMESYFIFSNLKINEILKNYYYTNERKEIGIKSLDYLLHYIVLKFEEAIQNQSSLVKTADELVSFLVQTYVTWGSDSMVGNDKGAEFINRIICCGKNSSDVKKLINQLVVDFSDQLKVMGKPTVLTEQNYMIHLLEKVILNKYKITKNDFTDCLLLSSCDEISSIPEMESDTNIVFITFDAQLKSYIETNNIYYNKVIYDQVYR